MNSPTNSIPLVNKPLSPREKERKKKKRWYQRKEKAMNKKKKRKRKNSHQHSFLCFPCKPLSLLFQPHSSVVSEILISWTLSVLAVLSSPNLDNTTSVRNIFLISSSSSLIRNTPAILSKYTSKVISLLSFIFFFFFSHQINIIGFMKLFSNQFLPKKILFHCFFHQVAKKVLFFFRLFCLKVQHKYGPNDFLLAFLA